MTATAQLLRPNVFLTRKDAAELLRNTGLQISESTLERLASNDDGPKFRKINGRALYTREWLEEWLQKQMKD